MNSWLRIFTVQTPDEALRASAHVGRADLRPFHPLSVRRFLTTSRQGLDDDMSLAGPQWVLRSDKADLSQKILLLF